MATRERTRSDVRDREHARPVPDEAPLEPEARSGGFEAPAYLNVIAGIWLIISPWVLGYTGGDAVWNAVIFGAAVGLLALAPITGGLQATWASWLNMASGVWLFVAGFWLESSAQASWNDWILGVIVFVLGAWAATPARGRAMR
jgi:hypothetical protein